MEYIQFNSIYNAHNIKENYTKKYNNKTNKSKIK